MFPVFEVFGREIGLYGICACAGFLLCGFLGTKLVKRFGVIFEDFLLVMLAALGGLFVGAHIIYGVTNIPFIVKTFGSLGELTFMEFLRAMGAAFGGMVFYGGFIGGALGIVVYTHFVKYLNRDNILDVYAVLIPLFHTFGRIGCFLAGCCYGVESAFGFTAHGNTVNPSVNDVNRFPVQLVEAACNLIIFLILLWMFKKMILSERLIYVYMLIYPPVRFVLEFFRGDTYRGFLFGLSTSQWISVILFLFAVFMLIKKSRKQHLPLSPENEV